MNEKLTAFARLLEIMDELREKCPWDKEQTLESLRKLTIEETYEPTPEFVNSGEGVSLATRVLNGGLVSGPEIQAGQPEVSFRCIQQRVKAPGPSDLVSC